MSGNNQFYQAITNPISSTHSISSYSLIDSNNLPNLDQWFGWLNIQKDENEKQWNSDIWNHEIMKRHVEWFKTIPKQNLESMIYIIKEKSFHSIQDILFFYFMIGWPIELSFQFILYVLEPQQSWTVQLMPFEECSKQEQDVWFMASCFYYIQKYVSPSFLKYIQTFYYPKKERFSLENYLTSLIGVEKEHASRNEK